MIVNPVLQIRFVKVNRGLLMDVLAHNNNALGCKPRPLHFGAANGFNIIFKPVYGWHLDIDSIEFGEAENENKSVFSKDANFEQVKNALTEFVQHNAFHGKDKPVPRIEKPRDECNYRLVVDKDSNVFACPVLYKQHVEALSAIAGKNLPIYEDKPMFASEWRKLFPRDLLIPMNALTMQEIETQEKIQKFNIENHLMGVEIWEFLMWENKPQYC